MMNEQSRRWISNLCLAAAVACALFFDAAGELRWPLGLVAVAASMIAALLHFRSVSLFEADVAERVDEEVAGSISASSHQDSHPSLERWIELQQLATIGLLRTSAFEGYQSVPSVSVPSAELDLRSIALYLEQLRHAGASAGYEVSLTADGRWEVHPLALEYFGTWAEARRERGAGLRKRSEGSASTFEGGFPTLQHQGT